MQDNFIIAVSEDHTLRQTYKDLTVTTQQIQALLTVARASGGKDECQVRLTGIEQEYWMGTEIGRLGDYDFRGTIAAGYGSNQPKRGENLSRQCESAGEKRTDNRGRRDAKRKDPARTFQT